MQQRSLGRTGLTVAPICIGTSALGGFPAQYGYDVGADQAIATLRAVFDSPFNFIDTSNEYGRGGDSERRIGQAMAERGGLPPGFVLASNGCTGRRAVPMPQPRGTVTDGCTGMSRTGVCAGYKSSFSHSSTAILSSARESTMQSR